MNATEEFWKGDFGTEYTARNRVAWRARVPFWRSILELTQPDYVLEMGCNAGWNLRAIRESSPGTTCAGVEINFKAGRQAQLAGFDVTICSIQDAGANEHLAPDLVFTAGVLIHVGPEEVNVVMDRVVAASNHYVLAVEYAAEAEEEVEYRGHAGRLWKRPFGQLYKQHGLKLVQTGNAPGFDRCTYWLMEKP